MQPVPLKNIRNFAIIAHVDHGKSTLADRLLEITHTVPTRSLRAQHLDTLELERERGITIKLQPVQMRYRYNDEDYVLNLIDTPGHVDFSYEVNRTLAAVEGVLLLVDASQGIEAQTLAHTEVAMANNLTLIPVINKIDLPNADPERVSAEMVKLLGVKNEEIIRVSGKEGTGVAELLVEIVKKIPEPKGDPTAPARALVFDSIFDPYRGVVAYVRVVDGSFKQNDPVKMMASRATTLLGHVGIFMPARTATPELTTGLTGYLETGLKEIKQVRVGDTIATTKGETTALPGYAPSEPKVYAAIFPVDPDKFVQLKESLARLVLNDAALHYEAITSQALGAGFRVGFLGLLHLEIVQERLQQEFNVEIISTTPSVPYRVRENGVRRTLQSPTELPAGVLRSGGPIVVEEPWARVEIVSPTQFVGAILQLVATRRGNLTGQEYLDPTRVIVRAEMPLADVIVGFFDRLKSVSRGYASLHYELAEYRDGDVVRLDILIAGDPVEALTMVVPTARAEKVGRAIVKSLKELVPEQQFAVPVQAVVGGKIIARETVRARRKDVTAKLYGGDVTRKRKLLEKQKKGKKRMATSGRVVLPPGAFIKLMKQDFYD